MILTIYWIVEKSCINIFLLCYFFDFYFPAKSFVLIIAITKKVIIDLPAFSLSFYIFVTDKSKF